VTDHSTPTSDERVSDMTKAYVRVVVIEAVVIAALWLLGRAFS
jgi:hypothetical protein